MKNKNKCLIIDGNNLAHRAYHQYKNMRSSDGKPSGVVFGVPYILWSLIKTHNAGDVIVAFDGGRDKNRLKAWPDYKLRKQKDDFDYEDFISQKEDAKKILECLGIKMIFKKGLEADDIIWLIARRYSRKGQVMIVSTDKDFVQLIDKNISLWNPWKNERITHLNYNKHYPFNPSQCVDYLSLDGDTSDNIPGYKGVGEKTALEFLSVYGSIENYLNQPDLPEHKKIKRDTLEEIYKRNKLLIDIKYFCKTTKLKFKDIPIIKPEKINKKELSIICSDYSINMFSKDDFILTYKKLLK